ncbi:F-box/LRR-repeat protein At4g29420-like [Carex rostrata]
MNIYACSQSTTMDDLPSDVILNIFERLPDSTDLANCRLTSHRFLSLSYRTSSISLKPHQKHHPVPFKTRVINLISLLAASLVSVSISGKGSGVVDTDEVDDLTDVSFLSAWLPLVGRQLGTLSIVNAPNKSPVGFSCALAVISDTCKNLDSLVIRNAWLSINGIMLMSKLTNLTLKFVRIDDEHLANFSAYFPSLKILNLIHITGLKEPKIHLMQLQICRFTGYPQSITIQAPNLEELKLRCMQPCFVILDCSSIHNLSISLAKASGISMITMPQNLRKLIIKSLDVPRLLPFFRGTKGLKTLELEVSPIMSWFDSYSVFSITDAFEIFENIDELIIGPVVWYLWHQSIPSCFTASEPISLSRLVVNLPPEDFNETNLMSIILKICAPSEVELRFFSDIEDMEKKDAVANFSNAFSGVRWSWSTSEKSSSEFFSRLWRGLGI